MKVGINLTKYVIQELNQVGECELENVYHSKFKNLYEIYSTLKHILNSKYMLKFSSKPLSIAKIRYNGNLQTQFNVVFFCFISFLSSICFLLSTSIRILILNRQNMIRFIPLTYNVCHFNVLNTIWKQL